MLSRWCSCAALLVPLRREICVTKCVCPPRHPADLRVWFTGLVYRGRLPCWIQYVILSPLKFSWTTFDLLNNSSAVTAHVVTHIKGDEAEQPFIPRFSLLDPPPLIIHHLGELDKQQYRRKRGCLSGGRTSRKPSLISISPIANPQPQAKQPRRVITTV
jgi:hypothetical protein